MKYVQTYESYAKATPTPGEYLYHGTLARALTGIRKSGLVRSTKGNNKKVGGWVIGKVFLAPTAPEAFDYGMDPFTNDMLYKQKSLVGLIVVLRVKTSDVPGEIVFNDWDQHTFYTEVDIPPNILEVWYQDKWQPLMNAKGVEKQVFRQKGGMTTYIDWEGRQQTYNSALAMMQTSYAPPKEQ